MFHQNGGQLFFWPNVSSKEFYVNSHWTLSVLVHFFLCLTNGHSHINRTYCPQEPSGLSGCSSLHFVAWVSAYELQVTMKADRKSEDAQKDDSDRERMGTEIKDKKKVTHKLRDLVSWFQYYCFVFRFLRADCLNQDVYFYCARTAHQSC